MTWTPSKPDMELIADAMLARVSPVKIAEALGIPLDALLGWRRACHAAALAEEAKHVKAAEAPVAPPPPKPAPVSPKIKADRVFERAVDDALAAQDGGNNEAERCQDREPADS